MALPPQSIPKENRAAFLRGRLAPASLLRNLEAATQPNRPFVVLIGIKSSPGDEMELREIYGPQFRTEVESDTTITDQLDELRALGFNFDWGGYTDSTGEEFMLLILRDPAAEARLRSRAANST